MHFFSRIALKKHVIYLFKREYIEKRDFISILELPFICNVCHTQLGVLFHGTIISDTSLFQLFPLFPLFLGSGPGRGRSPVEWGDFPSVRPYVRLSVRTSVPP